MKKDNLSEKQIKNIFQMYKDAHKLKTLVRSGWEKFGLDKKIRHESIAEHIFGCCMLALSIFSNDGTKGLNVDRVFLMLVLHETEEIFIGDLTPFDKEVENKKELGKQAVKKFFENAADSEYFLKVIEEFELNETEEAKFAHRIDKFETDIQAKYYDKHFIEGLDEGVLKSDRLQRCRAMGYSKISEYFALYDKQIFDSYFMKLLDNLNKDDKF